MTKWIIKGPGDGQTGPVGMMMAVYNNTEY